MYANTQHDLISTLNNEAIIFPYLEFESAMCCCAICLLALNLAYFSIAKLQVTQQVLNKV